MDRIKTSFSIKNLENISGIKAHTIRIWEKRYNLLSPERTDTNIRRYSLDSLRKLLNITLLYNNGFKISKIAALSDQEIPVLVRELAITSKSEQLSINSMKLAMINFDTILFDLTYEELVRETNFEFIYTKVFVPLMEELGILWQTNAISLTHEHFITNLIKQKIHVHTELVHGKKEYDANEPCFILFLPENEMHELSILFLNQLILSRGYRTIFLGQSVPSESLTTLLNFSSELHFVTFCVIEPNHTLMTDFLKDFEEKILKQSNARLSMFGPQTRALEKNILPEKVNIFDNIQQFKHRFIESTVII